MPAASSWECNRMAQVLSLLALLLLLQCIFGAVRETQLQWPREGACRLRPAAVPVRPQQARTCTSTPTPIPSHSGSDDAAAAALWLSAASSSRHIARLRAVYARLILGLPVHVAAVGGSNFVGSGVLRKTHVVPSLFLDALQRRFPINHTRSNELLSPREKSYFRVNQSSTFAHRMLNLGRSGSMSASTSFRVGSMFARSWAETEQEEKEDAAGSDEASLPPPPDLLLIDFAVNDMYVTREFAADTNSSSAPGGVALGTRANMERLVRQVLNIYPRTAMHFVHFCKQTGSTYDQFESAEAEHDAVAAHYSIPSVSLQSLLRSMLSLPSLRRSLFASLDVTYRAKGDSMTIVPGGLAQLEAENRIFMNVPHAAPHGHRILTDMLMHSLTTRIMHFARMQRLRNNDVDDEQHQQQPQPISPQLPLAYRPFCFSELTTPWPAIAGLAVDELLHTLSLPLNARLTERLRPLWQRLALNHSLSAPLPPPLSPGGDAADRAAYRVISYNTSPNGASGLHRLPAEARATLQLSERMWNWISPSGSQQKFGLVRLAAANATQPAHAQAAEEEIVITLSRAQEELHQVLLLYERSWRPDGATFDCWLTCSSNNSSRSSQRFLRTAALSLTTHWQQSSTQESISACWSLEWQASGGGGVSVASPFLCLRPQLHIQPTSAGFMRIAGVIFN